MIQQISAMPLWLSGLLIVVIPTALAMLGPVLVRRTWSLERLVTNNEVAGFKFAVLGVIYAVMLGFAVIVVWEKFNDAEQAVVTEAGASAALYRLSDALEPAARARLRDHLGNYLRDAIREDWPAMAAGRVAPGPSGALTDVYAAVLAIDARTVRDGVVMAEIFGQLETITKARRARLVLSSGTTPPVLWTTLCIGAAITVGFTFFFGSNSLRAQTMMAGLLAVLIFLALFVIIAIDHPFTGPVSVPPQALELVLRDLGA